MNVPAHQVNDILIAHIVVDSGTITVAGSSWTALPSAPANPVTQGIVSYLYYVKAAGSTETLTLTTIDAYVCGIYCYRDVDGTTPFDGVTPLHAGVATATPSGNFDTANAVIAKNNSSVDITGQITASSIAFDFDYDGNVQGGRTAGTDAAVSIVAQGLPGATWILTTFTITRATGQSITINADDERNYSNPA